MPTLALPEPEQRTCRDCGQEFTARYLPQHVCPSCVEARVRLTADELRQKIADERIVRLRECGITGRLAAMTLTAFHARYQPEAAAAARQFVQDWPRSRSLVLLGKPGTGKTHLAVGVLLALADRGVYGRYVHVPSLLAELRRATDQREAERRYLDPLFAAPLVVLDDVGREKTTEHWQQWIDVLVNDRWVAEQPIIITANLDTVGLTQWLGGASASRLLSEALRITMREGDMRRVQLPPPPAAASGDPTKPCVTCAGAGWMLDERVPVGRRERLMQCPSCAGKGY